MTTPAPHDRPATSADNDAEAATAPDRPDPRARVRVRIHPPPAHRRVVTAAGRDGSALYLMWLWARWRSRTD